MNVEFHYYSTAFLAVKAGFGLEEATTIAYSGQYVDHHHRALEIQTSRGLVLSGPTQNFSFWDPATVQNVLEPFHFFPAGANNSVRRDGTTSLRDVRPNSPGVKALLVEALKSRDLYRIGLALHTFSDTWAHQNFTALDERWNRLDPASRMPSPGHAHAGLSPDLWLETWTDPRLVEATVVNRVRFRAAAQKVYRYLCTYRGRGFEDEEAVLEALVGLVEAGRGRDSVEDRVIEFILELNLEPYDRTRWWKAAVEGDENPSRWPLLDQWKKAGSELLDRTGLSLPAKVRARQGFEDSDFAAWLRAADAHRASARRLIAGITGS